MYDGFVHASSAPILAKTLTMTANDRKRSHPASPTFSANSRYSLGNGNVRTGSSVLFFCFLCSDMGGVTRRRGEMYERGEGKRQSVCISRLARRQTASNHHRRGSKHAPPVEGEYSLVLVSPSPSYALHSCRPHLLDGKSDPSSRGEFLTLSVGTRTESCLALCTLFSSPCHRGVRSGGLSCRSSSSCRYDVPLISDSSRLCMLPSVPCSNASSPCSCSGVVGSEEDMLDDEETDARAISVLRGEERWEERMQWRSGNSPGLALF